MPSRKKAKGKARKAAKEEKAKEEESQTVVGAANQRQEESLEAQMHRLVIDDVTPQKCQHGLLQSPPEDHVLCIEFIDVYLAAFNSQNDVCGAFNTAYFATSDEYVDVYDSKLDTVISILLSFGISVLSEREDNRLAQVYASWICYFEEYTACAVRKKKAVINWTKPFELLRADDHTLVSYYRKRISCSCLDEKYKEVKSVKKMGWCCNPSCSLPEKMVERSKMFFCTRCSEVNYCSVECQKNHWKEHKGFCARTAEMKAAFRSNQT